MKKQWLFPIMSSLVILDLLAIVLLVRAFYFAYFYQVFMTETKCEDIPQGSTVLALGFEHLGETNGVIQPGMGNVEIARQLAACADHLALVVTQKAISDAMEQEGLLEDEMLLGKVYVRQMHSHQTNAPVHTFQALQIAVKNLAPLPDTLVLMAHDKQIERAIADLKTIYPGQIIPWKQNGIAYSNSGWLLPLRWAMRELYLARPVEAWLRWRQ